MPHRERRRYPRPPLWLNLFLLVIAAATFAYAKHEREVVRQKMTVLFKPSPRNPAELNRIREELADMDVSKQQLAAELDGRLRYRQSQQEELFYIAIDTTTHKLHFRLGKEVLRDTDVAMGEGTTITSRDGRTWRFVPLKGAFTVEGKESGYDWPVPEWVYAMKHAAPPATPVSVANGLGKYVIHLPNGYVIHSPPPPDSPLQGAKPGSFMVPEADLAAIWPRITTDTRVYIF
jgi:hypothetical protein